MGAKSTSERLARELSQSSATGSGTPVKVDELDESQTSDTVGRTDGDVNGFLKALAAAEAETERLRDLLADADIRCPTGVEQTVGDDSVDTAFSSWSALSDAF